MGLFFEVLSAINNPDRQGSVDKLSSIMKTAEQLSATEGIQASKIQDVLSILGSFIRPYLQTYSKNIDRQTLDDFMSQFTGNTNNLNMGDIQSFLTPQLQQQIIRGIAQRTGLGSDTSQKILPTLISAMFAILNLGSGTKNNMQNSILNAFLDSEHDGDVDLGDVFKFANRFLNPSF